MTEIIIKNLRTQAIIGTNSFEREEKQEIIINTSFIYDDSKASVSDNLEDAVNYKEIEDKIKNYCDTSRYYLLEKLSESLINLILEYKQITTASITIEKPGALDFSDSVSISKTRKNK